MRPSGSVTRWTAAVAAVLLCASDSGRADGPGPAEVVITFPSGGLELGELLQWVGHVCRGQIAFPHGDARLSRRIRFSRGEIGIRADEIRETVGALLLSQGLCFRTIGPPGYEIDCVMDARLSGLLRRAAPVELNDENLGHYEARDDVYVCSTIRVRHAEDLQGLGAMLESIVSSGGTGTVSAIPEARAFLVTDFAPRVVAIYRQIRALDVPPVPRVRPERFPLAHAKAAAVAATLTDLFASRRRAASLDADGSPGIVADPATNQVVVLGTEADIAAIRTLVSYLDGP